MWFLARESVYLINMNADRDYMVKQCATCLDYQQMQLQGKALHFEILCRPWKVIDADVFMINSKTLLCIVDYHSEKVNSLSADNLVQMTKLIFVPKENCVRHGCKLYIQYIQRFL